ncbi:hypothetical protein [Trueperella pyogenes]|uniref:hypothetical protein n=1 Tax=Trueperella pyogenes TaxID=1661 RepID=UPI0014332FA9|nr:hypothetical protein [Trueperella pyogenes]QIU86705.1 hypothetical protein HEP79_05420 [Trueperella pyogenes]
MLILLSPSLKTGEDRLHPQWVALTGGRPYRGVAFNAGVPGFVVGGTPRGVGGVENGVMVGGEEEEDEDAEGDGAGEHREPSAALPGAGTK